MVRHENEYKQVEEIAFDQLPLFGRGIRTSTREGEEEEEQRVAVGGILYDHMPSKRKKPFIRMTNCENIIYNNYLKVDKIFLPGCKHLSNISQLNSFCHIVHA